jgi:hypothetical protein
VEHIFGVPGVLSSSGFIGFEPHQPHGRFLVQGHILNVGGDALRACNRRIMRRQNSKYFENHTHKKNKKTFD